MIGVFANAPKMLWIDCPDDLSCNKCLDIAFESENDIACLHQKYPENGCVFEGALMNGGSMVVVSSDECFIDGTLENIQVSLWNLVLLCAHVHGSIKNSNQCLSIATKHKVEGQQAWCILIQNANLAIGWPIVH